VGEGPKKSTTPAVLTFHSMADEKEIRRLRALLEEELRKDKLDAALRTMAELERAEPKVSRHPHKRGDLLRRMGRISDAVGAYDRAVALYADEGFLARAVAMAKTVLVLDPTRMDVLERVDPAAAAMMAYGPANAGTTTGSHAAILPEDGPAPTAHAAVIPEDAPAPTAHAAVIPEDAPAPMGHAAVIPEVGKTTATYGAFIPESAPPLTRPQIVESAPPLTRPQIVESAPPLARPLVTEEPAPPAPPATAPPPPAPPLPRPPRRPKFSSRTMAAVHLPPIEPQAPATPPARTSIRPAASLPPQAKPGPLDDSDLMLSAPELVRAPDAALNEVRFSDLPPAPRPGPPPLPPGAKKPPPLPARPVVREATATDLAGLPLFPLFATLPKDSLQELVRESSLIELSNGKYVIRRGDPSDCMYGIVEGSVQMRPPGLPPELYAVLSEGDVFGESCLLRDEPRHADAVVHGSLTALRIPKTALDTLVRKNRTVADVLLHLLTRRLIQNLIHGSHLFAGVDDATRAELTSMFEVRRAPVGTALMEKGKRSDGLYIALTGRVVCTLPGIEATIEAGPGSMFGHTSLLGAAPTEVGVETMVNMIVLRLPAARFSRLAMEHSEILARISELPSIADVTL